MIDKNINYVISSLEKKHDKNKFKCGIDSLDQYLKTQAGQDIKKNVAVTYVLTTPHSTEILGYYTLSSLGIFPGELPDNLIKKLPRYPVLPGILIGRLAVDQNSQKKSIGSYLLIDAMKRSISVSNQIGVVAIVVDAKNDKAIGFYTHFGFTKLPENSRRLFLSLDTVKKLDLTI
ncbi:MAG TPA: GNAT family N-acetyltransferase [Gammaproteobacteria bacterium]|nr:GNAT family N-acetyltransferase [Gammaproteobacteria bacterium]